jgi:uncharacterized membrane protein
MRVQKDLQALLEAQVIDQGTADAIAAYYKAKGEQSPNRLLVVFGVMGAILVGLGIILILAHNWDNLSRGQKTILAFVPLLLGQIIAGLSLAFKSESQAWREGSASFLFFGVGASISLISQVYNLPLPLLHVLAYWALLCLPIIYIMRSSVAALLYLVLITACAVMDYDGNIFYWIAFAAFLPHYYKLYEVWPRSNYMTIHHWLVPLSLGIGMISGMVESPLYWITLISLAGFFYVFGKHHFVSSNEQRIDGYTSWGAISLVIILLILSFDDAWRGLEGNFWLHTDTTHPAFWVGILALLGTVYVLYQRKQTSTAVDWQLMDFASLLFIPVFVLGIATGYGSLLTNLLVFTLAVGTIVSGAKREALGTLNLGLLMIALLVAIRYFDTNMSFVLRGLLFIAVGAGFFVANYWMLKKKKSHEK